MSSVRAENSEHGDGRLSCALHSRILWPQSVLDLRFRGDCPIHPTNIDRAVL